MIRDLLALIDRYRQLLTFCVIGVLNTATHSSVVVFLVELYSLSSVAANILGFMAANAISYILNSIFTFKSKLLISKYIRFLATSLVSLLIIVSISSICEFLGIYYLYSLAIVLVASPLINFALLKRFAFR